MDHANPALDEAPDMRERAQQVHLITQAQAALGDDCEPNKGGACAASLAICAVLLALLLAWLAYH
ncbi:hypothetical protein [Pseudacidovorax intermedius]|uniref:hypothetical protein n=1 Tax=Pseudacidovorax intermedius TaxID=433924 RepID=UPI00128E9910|nr:hypothetical protein [Pseudacidovorax intermedius]